MFETSSNFRNSKRVFFKLFSFFSILSLVLVSLTINAQTQSKYVLDVGDKIKIVVFEEPDMSFELNVDNSGVFAYPYLGDIQLIGKTTSELESELIEGLIGSVLIKPNISVSLVEYRTFSIGGEVNDPGSYSYEPNLTVKKAINLAGGVTDWSNGKRFKLDRARPVSGEKFNSETLIFPGDTLTILPRRF